MSTPETALQAEAPQPPNLAGLTPEQIQALVNQGVLDPSMVPPEVANAPYEQAASSYAVPQTPEAQAALQRDLMEAETRAIAQAERVGGAPESPSFLITEAAQKDKDVQAARHKIEDVFGGQATEIEKTAVKEALDATPVITEDKAKMTESIVNGRSERTHLEQTTGDINAAKEFAALRDKAHGRADVTVDNIGRRSRAELQEHGIQRTSVKQLGNEALKAGGAKLATTEGAEEALDEAVGNEVVRALVDGKPKLSQQLRQEIRGMIAKPGELSVLARAVANGRHGSLSNETRRQVGKRFRRSHRPEA